MKIKYLTTSDILKIHDKIIGETGGHSGLLFYSNLDFEVAKSKIPKTLERSATTLFYGILSSHAFVDGNKRTSFVVMEIFLEKNSKKLKANEEEVWKIIKKISEGKLKFEEVVHWIKQNIGD